MVAIVRRIARRSHSSWKTGSPGSISTGPNPCIPPRSCTPSTRPAWQSAPPPGVVITRRRRQFGPVNAARPGPPPAERAGGGGPEGGRDRRLLGHAVDLVGHGGRDLRAQGFHPAEQERLRDARRLV